MNASKHRIRIGAATYLTVFVDERFFFFLAFFVSFDDFAVVVVFAREGKDGGGVIDGRSEGVLAAAALRVDLVVFGW
jgi:hypothetical protein